MEKIVGAVAWIPLHISAGLAVVCLNLWVIMSPCWPEYDYEWCYSANSFVAFYETMAEVLLFEVILITTQSIVHCLYPILALAELMLVIAVARYIKRLFSKESNKN